MTAQASTGVSEGRVGRYLLEDLVAESKTGSQFWRASDPALKRAVGARLIPVGDPRVPAVREAARSAARVHDRRIVQVLDVVETREHLAVISEWVTGRPWSEVVRETDDPAASAVVAYEVALALRAAHRLGVTHGRLRPASVMVTETDEVRVRGLQVDAALYGVTPGLDPYAADLHGVGSMLFLGLTKRWPDEHHVEGTLDGIPVVGPIGNRMPTADEIVAGVPPTLSRIAAACMASPEAAPGTSPIPDMEHAVAALSQSVKGTASPAPGQGRRGAETTDRMVRGLALIVIAGILLAATALVLNAVYGSQTTASSDAVDATVPPRPTSSPSRLQAQPLPIASITDFDPQGADRQENPELAPFAIDGDPETAWTTVAYKSSSMNPKDGTGLLLDLGLVRPIREIRLQLVGAGTDVEIRIADQAGDRAEDFELLAGAVGVGPELTIRTPVPVQTRMILVWLTDLPYGPGTYIGGVREVQILG